MEYFYLKRNYPSVWNSMTNKRQNRIHFLTTAYMLSEKRHNSHTTGRGSRGFPHLLYLAKFVSSSYLLPFKYLTSVIISIYSKAILLCAHTHKSYCNINVKIQSEDPQSQFISLPIHICFTTNPFTT